MQLTFIKRRPWVAEVREKERREWGKVKDSETLGRMLKPLAHVEINRQVSPEGKFRVCVIYVCHEFVCEVHVHMCVCM